MMEDLAFEIWFAPVRLFAAFAAGWVDGEMARPSGSPSALPPSPTPAVDAKPARPRRKGKKK